MKTQMRLQRNARFNLMTINLLFDTEKRMPSFKLFRIHGNSLKSCKRRTSQTPVSIFLRMPSANKNQLYLDLYLIKIGNSMMEWLNI